jgi:tRNA(Arg) A34 adenosine deaminase TadA
MKLRFFDLARKVSYRSTSKYKLGTVIVNKNIIHSFGWNDMRKTHPLAKTYGNFLHSEIHSLIGVPYEHTKGSHAYIYREDLNGVMKNSRPCPICLEALALAGIKKIFYTTQNGFREEIL